MQRFLARRGYVGISEAARQEDRKKVRFAVVGDVHGQFSLLSKRLEELSHKHSIDLDFVLQVGDIECHRHEEDLKSMAAPAKHRALGDFWRACHHDNFYMKHPLYFIGGNHECFGWLDNEGHFSQQEEEDTADDSLRGKQAFLEVAPNMFYLGRAGYLPLRFFEQSSLDDTCTARDENDAPHLNILGILHLGYLSGIHQPDDYYHRRPAMTEDNLSKESNKRWIGFNIYDTQLLLEDEEDDGIDHNHTSTSYEGTAKLPAIASQPPDDGSIHQELMVVLARLLGVDVTHNELADSDILLSSADVKFLTRFLVPASACGSAAETEKKRCAVAETLPHSLDGIARLYMKGRSVGAIKNLMENRLKRKRACDVFLTHDWPSGFDDQGYNSTSSVAGKRSRPIGNDVCRELTDELKPKLHCCGHMHHGYRYEIRHKKKSTELCCLGKVGLSGPAAFAVFELDLESGDIVELGQDPELCKLGAFEEEEEEE